MKVTFTAAECTAHAEAYAALGHDVYVSDARLRAEWVAANLSAKRAAEDERAAHRHAREQRWRLIAAGALDPQASTRTKPAHPPRLDAAPDDCLSIADAAERLNVPAKTLRQRAARGSVQAYKVAGRGILIPLAEIDRLLVAV